MDSLRADVPAFNAGPTTHVHSDQLADVELFAGLIRAYHRRDFGTATLALRQLRACGWSICRLGGREVRP